jgi:ubiquinone/menaquinone biosynthesis C-methylase UbiE
VVSDELARMYRGEVIAPYQGLADAVRHTEGQRGRIVEVGCASGYYYEVLSHLLGHEIRYLGVDYSRAMIDQARRHYPGVPFLVADATNLPFGDSSCDLLISGTVLLHVQNYPAVIAESARVTRRWAIFHKTPTCRGATRYYTKNAYGVRCVEIVFGRNELEGLFRTSDLAIDGVIQMADDLNTFVCRKIRSTSEGETHRRHLE